MSPNASSKAPGTAATSKAQVQPNHYPRPGDMGNCVGCILPKTSLNPNQPNALPETQEEGWWEKLKQGSAGAAQYYKDNVSEALHEFGGSAMDTGGKVATAGGATAAAGGAVALTGVGAPVGAAMATAGAATGVVGGVVAGVGASTDTAATVLDSAADWAITGKAPDMLTPALALGQRLLTGMVMKKVPGLGGGGGKNPKADQKGGGSEPPGGYVLGVGGPCIVGTYDQIRKKCGEGQQAHHIVPDTLARTTNRKQGSKGIGRIPGMATFGGGPSICLQGNARTQGSEHNTAHQCDSEICEAAKRTDNGLLGTIPVSEAVPVAMKAAIAARPECKAQIEAEVRRAYPDFEKDNRSMNGAGKPAEGEAKAHLESGGRSDTRRNTKRR